MNPKSALEKRIPIITYVRKRLII